MNTFSKILGLSLVLCIVGMFSANAQQLQYFRAPSKAGLNVFETPKDNETSFDGVKIKVGADFALQFQGLSQETAYTGDTLVELSNNFNLPTANLNLDAQLADGMRVHLRTYLSSRHHTESYVEGGYLQIDRLDFIKEGFLSGFMDLATIRVGMDEINYGDTHFRRSNNALAIYNPFVGNYIMDSYTTEPYLELTLQGGGILGVIGATNGRLNQSSLPGDDGMVVYAKLGYDKQIDEDLRVRLTGSIYSSSKKSTRDYLYGGDRTGARYYNILRVVGGADSPFLPRFNPGFKYQTAFQINPFVKFAGLEVFGVFEVASNGDKDTGGAYTQIGAEALYRFGSWEQLYVGGRYNAVSGKGTDGDAKGDISRINVGGGWFLTPNVLAKLEYVTQDYSGDKWANSIYQDTNFSGLMLEAAISF
ncbi:MAG: hypothetical protein R2798_01965 [Chitinophagales bacterium]|nr:hypothetical protein [Bacteroidota bacterium]MCB9042799.1 hypothetical protein [Chitinophagales bacterium]